MQTQSLHKIQGKLVQFITAPESVLKNPQSRKLHAFIKPSQTLTPEERVDIYANMYFFRLLEGLKKYTSLSKENIALLEDGIQRFKLSGRSTHRILKISRTIADLAESEAILSAHLLEAFSYRVLERG